MTEQQKNIIMIILGILAFYGLWTLALYFALQVAHKSATAWRKQARDLAEMAVTRQQQLAGANRYFNSATQIDAAPYANLVIRARKIVKAGYELAGVSMKTADRYCRSEIKPTSPKHLFFIAPPTIELIKWLQYAAALRKVTTALAEVQKIRQDLATIDSEIAVMGRRQKRQFEEMRARAAELEAQRKGLASPANPMITEGVSLAGAMSSLDLVFEGLLADDDPPRQNVVDAYRWQVEINQILNEVDKKMHRRPSAAQDANYALQVALRQHGRLEQALSSDAKQYGPFPQLSTKALALRKQLGQVSNLLQARSFQSALDQAQQLPIEIQALHNTLEQVKVWRGKVSDQYAQAYGIIIDYESRLSVVRQGCDMDISDPIMESARQFLRQLDDLRLSEDLAALSEANQIKRDFDLKVADIERAFVSFAEQYAGFNALSATINQTTVDDICKRSADLATALASIHPAYIDPISPDVVSIQRTGLLAQWRLLAVQLARPRQSQLEALIKMMAQPILLQSQLVHYADAISKAVAQKESDCLQAQTMVRQMDELIPTCFTIADDLDTAQVATAADFQARRDELAQSLSQPDNERVDYPAIKAAASSALEQMRAFVDGYNDQKATVVRQATALRQTLSTVATELRELATNGALDLQVDSRFQSDIQAWTNTLQSQMSNALVRHWQSHCEAGRRLIADTNNYIARLKHARDSFVAEQKRVEDHAAAARALLDGAIQPGRGTHADDAKDQPDRIAPIKQQLDKATATLARLSVPAPRYSLANGRADLKLANSLLDYAELMTKNL